MKPPEVTTTVSGYSFDFKEDKLVVNVSRLKLHSDKLTGDIKLILGKAKKEEPGFNFNFSSAETRKRLVTSLSQKYPDWLSQWLGIIDELCRNIQTLAVQGEPVTEITTEDEVGDLEYLVKPIIPLGKPTAIFGDPGSGKSQVLTILAIVAALPWTDNPLNLIAPEEPSPILYLDYEADPDDMRRSLKKISQGMDLGFIPLYYRRCSLPIADDLEAIRNHAEQVKAKAVFVDSTSLAAGGDLNRMDVATAYIRALRQLKTTTVSLTHTSKDRDSKTKTIIGSVLFEAGFRSVFECRGQEEDNTLEIALFHRKFNLGAKAHTLGYRINYNSHGNTVEWHDPASVPEFVARMSNTKQILDLLKTGQYSAKEIAEELEISIQASSMSLKRLSNKNLIMKLGDKRWGLPVL